jgi:hypothetical protein
VDCKLLPREAGTLMLYLPHIFATLAVLIIYRNETRK